MECSLKLILGSSPHVTLMEATGGPAGTLESLKILPGHPILPVLLLRSKIFKSFFSVLVVVVDPLEGLPEISVTVEKVPQRNEKKKKTQKSSEAAFN